MLLLLATVPTARAYPVHRQLFRVAYGKPVACELCHGHGGGTERNAYGKAWHKAGESLKAFHALETGDSDGDGSPNRAEIDAGSNPGDPESTPEAPGDRWQRASTQVFVPMEQLELVFDSVERVDAAEVQLTDEQAKRIEEASGRTLDLEDRLPTFYFNVENGTRTSVALFHQFGKGRGTHSLLLNVGPDGTARHIVLFRAPGSDAQLYHPYLRCLEGTPKEALEDRARSDDCPKIPGRQRVQLLMAQEIGKALFVVAEYLRSAEASAAEAREGEVPEEVEPGKNAEAPSEEAPPEASKAPLPFDAVSTTTTKTVMPAPIAIALALLAMVFLLAAIHASSRWAMARPEGRWPSLGAWPGPARLAACLITLGLMLAQLLAIITAFVQTQSVHASTWAYFQHLSVARLLGTSHAHMFGYSITYGTLGLFLSMTRAPLKLRSLTIAAMLWAGPFDVLSWWGMKLHSPYFEWVTFLTGALAGTGSVLAAYYVARDAFFPADEADEAGAPEGRPPKSED